MADENLHNMLNALLKGEQDSAKEFFHNRATEIMTKVVNPPEEAPVTKIDETMNAYDIYKDKKLLDTVWYGAGRNVDDIREALIADGHDPHISVVKRKEKKKED